jgi:hypothetical protein
MKKGMVLLVLLLLWSAAPGFADRGSIPFKPGVKVFEPNQRAMIAWNGTEEILLLSTDLKASEPTKVLEVLPLPSEPQVKKGEVEVFRRATALINKKIALHSKGLSRGLGAPKSAAPAGEVTFHQKIGAHDISVTHVLNQEGFIDWVQNYLKSAGVQNPTIPPAMQILIGQYLKAGFAWFVFDVVSLDQNLKTIEAIQYRFKTNSLYYPMKISGTGEGSTSIELLVLTPQLLTRFPGIPRHQIELRHAPISLTSQELRSLSPEMDDLLGHREDMKLRIWRLKGEISSFKEDLIAHGGI